MTSRQGGSPWVVGASLLFVGIAGCAEAGDAGRASTPAPATSTPAPARATRARAPRPTTTTTTPPYSFDGSVPPPPLHNTGTDYVAIVKSLDRYRQWLAAHNPEAELLDVAYAPGSQVRERFRQDLELLRANNLRLLDIDQRVQAWVEQPGETLVTLRARESIAGVRLVDRDGNTVDEQPRGPVRNYLVVVVRDSEAHWRFGEVTELLEDPEVQL